MAIPYGFTAALDRRTRVDDAGRALLGGFPAWLLRLTPLVGRQASALLARHGRPLAAVGCLASPRLAPCPRSRRRRRRRRHRASSTSPTVSVRYGIARRLDGLAYGSGVRFSALRGRSTVVQRLRPMGPGRAAERVPGGQGEGCPPGIY